MKCLIMLCMKMCRMVLMKTLRQSICKYLTEQLPHRCTSQSYSSIRQPKLQLRLGVPWCIKRLWLITWSRSMMISTLLNLKWHSSITHSHSPLSTKVSSSQCREPPLPSSWELPGSWYLIHLFRISLERSKEISSIKSWSQDHHWLLTGWATTSATLYFKRFLQQLPLQVSTSSILMWNHLGFSSWSISLLIHHSSISCRSSSRRMRRAPPWWNLYTLCSESSDLWLSVSFKSLIQRRRILLKFCGGSFIQLRSSRWHLDTSVLLIEVLCRFFKDWQKSHPSGESTSPVQLFTSSLAWESSTGWWSSSLRWDSGNKLPTSCAAEVPSKPIREKRLRTRMILMKISSRNRTESIWWSPINCQLGWLTLRKIMGKWRQSNKSPSVSSLANASPSSAFLAPEKHQFSNV